MYKIYIYIYKWLLFQSFVLGDDTHRTAVNHQCRSQAEQTTDGFIRSVAFEFTLKSYIDYHKILWFVCLLSTWMECVNRFEDGCQYRYFRSTH